jgi:hypothetical protein
MNLTGIKNFGKKLIRNRKLTKGIGVGLVIAGITLTAIRACRDTPEVERILKEKEEDKGEALTLKEKAPVIFKGYWKTIAIGTATILLVAGMAVADEKSYAGLAAAYAIAQDKITNYKESVEEITDQKTADKINQTAIKKQMKSLKEGNFDIIKTAYGDQLFFDSFTGRYFTSDIEYVRKVVNVANKRMLDETYVTLDDIYWDLGLPSSDVGGKLGWEASRDDLIDIRFDTILTDDERACVTMEFKKHPRELF